MDNKAGKQKNTVAQQVNLYTDKGRVTHVIKLTPSADLGNEENQLTQELRLYLLQDVVFVRI